MSKNDIDLDEDWGLDDDLDLDMDFEPPETALPEGRDAIIAAPKVAAKKAAETIAGEGKRRKLILDSLPKDYTVAADAYDTVASEGREVYREAKQQLNHTKRDLQRTTREALPTLRKYLPDRFTNKINNWAKDDSYTTGEYSEADARENTLNAMLDDTFSSQVNNENEQRAAAEEKIEADLKDAATVVRQDSLNAIISKMRGDTANLVAYNQVSDKYRRKLLEVNWRQYYALTDLLSTTQTSFESLLPSIEAIVKNTALPDYAKEEFNEITSAMMKREIVNKLSPGQFAQEYVGKLGSNVKKAVGEFGQTVRDGISMGSMMIPQDDPFDSPQEEDLSPAQQNAKLAQSGAQLAGSQFAGRVINPQIRKMQKYLREKGEENEFISTTGAKLRYNATNIPEMLNDLANDPNREGASGAASTIANMLQSVLPSFSGDRGEVTGLTPEELSKNSPWTTRNDVTLNEVLPGWLSKINDSICELGGFNNKTEMFDYTTRNFVDVDEIQERIADRVGDNDTREYVRTSIDKLVETITKDKDIDEGAKESLGRMLDEKIRNVSRFNVEELATTMDSYGKEQNSEHVYELQALFDEIRSEGTKSEQRVNVDVSDELRRIRSAIAPVQDTLDELTATYGGTAVANSAAFTRKGGELVYNRDINDSYKKFTHTPKTDPVGRAKVENIVTEVADTMREREIDRPIETKPTRQVKKADSRMADMVNDKRDTEIEFGGIVEQLQNSFTNIRGDVSEGVRSALFGEAEPNLATTLAKISANKGSAESNNNLQDIVTKVHEQLVANNLEPQVNTIVEVLNEMMTNGLPTSDAESESGDKPKRAGYFGRFGTQARKSGETLASGVKNAAGRLNTARKFIGDKIPKLRLFDKLNDTRKGISAGLNGMADAFQGIADIRDEDGNIILIGRKLKAGKYFDSDGKVIKSIKDITGAIYDENGVVLTEEEVREKKDQFTYYTQKGWKKLSEGIGRLAGNTLSNAFGVPQVVMDKVRKYGGDLIKKVKTSRDIYVEGEPSPRLQHKLMLDGFYIDRNTVKVIRGVSDITGAVYNKHKEVVISQEEFDNPDVKFVDVDGKPFEGLVAKVIKRAEKAKDFAFKMATKAKDSAVNIATSAKDHALSAKDWVKEKITGEKTERDEDGSPINIKRKAGNRMADRLDDIYRLLDDRLGKADVGDSVVDKVIKAAEPDDDKPAFDDTDGDGDRDGGFRDILDRRKEAREKKAADKKSKKNKEKKDKKDPSSGFFGSMLSGLSSKLMSLAGGVGTAIAGSFAGKALGLLSDGMGGLFNKLNPFSSSKPDVPGGKKPGMIKRAASFIAGKGKAALSVGATVGRQVLMAGARYAATAAVGAIGTISAPVVLGIAAVGAIGYGAYRLFTDMDIGYLMSLRLAQYGTEDYDSGGSDEPAKLLWLEDLLLKHTTFEKGGTSTLKGLNAQKATEAAKEFGIDVEDPKAVEMFERWLYGRFIPVFLLWTSRARQYAPGVNLRDIDKTEKVEPKLMLKILDGVMLPVDHPVFRVMHSPFGSRGVMDTVGGWFGGEDMMSGEKVKEVEASVREEIVDLVKNHKEPDKKTKSAGKAGSAEAGVQSDGDSKWYNLPTEDLKKNEDGSVEIGGRRFHNKSTFRKVRKAMRQHDETKRKAGLKQELDVSVNSLRNPSDLNALEGIRVRCYGLNSLDVDKIETLWGLEVHVMPSISVTNSAAVSNIETDKVAQAFMNKFGLNYDNEEHRARWVAWFEGRFVPVFLRYIGTVKQHAPNADAINLIVSPKNSWVLKVASAMISLRTMYEGNLTSIWNVTVSPFVGMQESNSDMESVDSNMKYLQSQIKKALANEDSADDGSVIKMDATESKKAAPKKKMKTGTDMSRDIINNVRSAGTSDIYSGSSTTPSGEFERGTSSIPIGEMGNAVEDANSVYGSIRLRGDDKESVANMIKEIAKATGVDENLLLTVAMMESSLNPKAGAGTSSAKGLYQFINGTWKEQLEKHGNKYGIPAGAGPYDPVANALLGAEYLRSGSKAVERAMPSGVKAGPEDLYLAHFLGHGGASKFIRKLYKTPDRKAAEDFMGPAKANPGIFTDRGRILSYSEIHDKLRQKAENRFTYVSKYATNPQLKPKSAVASNEDGKTVTTGTPNTVGTEQARTQIVKTKVNHDVNKAVSQHTSPVAAPTSKGVGTSTANTASVVKTKAAEVVSNPQATNPAMYAEQVRQELSGQIAAKEKDLAEIRNSMKAHHVEQQQKSTKILEQQLTFLEEMALHLRQMNEKTSFDGTPKEAAQKERAQQSERRNFQQKIVHDTSPISVGRQRT